MDYRCPNCGSENIQKYSVIYNNGTSNYTSETEISGYVERDFLNSDPFSGTASTQGVSITNLAQTVAPPQKENGVGCGAVVGALVVWAIVGKILDFFMERGFLWHIIVGGLLLFFAVVYIIQGKRHLNITTRSIPNYTMIG